MSVAPKLAATLSSHRSGRNPSIMKLLRVSILFGILLKCVVASGDGMGAGFKEAVDEEDFGWLKCVAASGDAVGVRFKEALDKENVEWLHVNWWAWKERKDLFDYVIRKGADFAVKLIQMAEFAKGRVLAALFDKGEKGVIDGVLKKINCRDSDLYDLTNYRSELAGSPEKFFRILDKIKGSWNQERAVRRGVSILFEAGKHDLVVPLVNALGKRTFKGKSLKNAAIQEAFEDGVRKGNQDIVGTYCEHPAVTAKKYAAGLRASWKDGEPNQLFPFLLGHADQGDLEKTKEEYVYSKYPEFRQFIVKVSKTAPPTGSRHLRPIERAVSDVLASITGASNEYGPGSIIGAYILDEAEKTKEPEPVMGEVGVWIVEWN